MLIIASDKIFTIVSGTAAGIPSELSKIESREMVMLVADVLHGTEGQETIKGSPFFNGRKNVSRSPLLLA